MNRNHGIHLSRRLVAELRYLTEVHVRGMRSPGTLARYLEMKGGIRVLGGPFEGLCYHEKSSGSSWLPKILGTYEKEIAEIFNRYYLEQFEAVLDIGCAEGYYLAGIGRLLRTLPRPPRLIGYDIDEKAIANARDLLSLNEIRSELYHRPVAAADFKANRRFYIVDIEGAESDMFNELIVRKLNESDLLIEIHDTPGQHRVLNDLGSRFAATHTSRVFSKKERTLFDFPNQSNLPMTAAWKFRWMDEGRKYGNQWLHLRSKDRRI
jgi:hypothetical protein